MPEQHRFRSGAHATPHNLVKRQVVEFAVDQADLMTRIDQRPGDRQQAQWRQMLARRSAPDRRMRDVDH